MRQHPIPPVTEPNQYRAIGVVRGRYVPSEADQLTRGHIHTADGDAIEAVVLGRLLTLMRRHLDPDSPHLWVVYPRSRDEQQLHLQMVGVWEPSTLDQSGDDAPAPDDSASEAEATTDGSPDDELDVGDDYFSVRGELIYTRPETGDLVVKIRQKPRADGSRPIPFKLQLRGEIPLDHLRHFVALDLRRQGQKLAVESFDVMGPVAQRGNRGGKGRRQGGGSGGGGERSRRDRQAATERRGTSAPGPHGKATSRPSRWR